MNLFISNFVAYNFDISLHENCIAIWKILYIYIFSRKQDYPFDRAEFSRKLSFFNFTRSPVASFLVWLVEIEDFEVEIDCTLYARRN